MEISKQV